VRLVVDGVRFAYPDLDREVLRGVTFDVPAGSSVAITGPSGSGKSTLLSLVGGLLRPERGDVHAVGPDGMRRAVPDVGTWIIQTVSLLPSRTVLDNVALGAHGDGASLPDARRRSTAALEMVGLADRADDRARVLSGGEAQRVAIARALASDRPVLLADEPTGQLDAATTTQVLDAMFAPSTQRTVLVVTHDPDVAARCDRVVQLRDGLVEDVAA